MTDFTCIGYDLRRLPIETFATVDATEWPDHEQCLTQAHETLRLNENLFQLTQIDSDDELKRLVAFAQGFDDAALISIELPNEVLAACDIKWKCRAPRSFFREAAFDLVGLDVCDIDGFFSVLAMGVLPDAPTALFPASNLQNALALTQSANILVPSHAPFVVAKMRVFAGA